MAIIYISKYISFVCLVCYKALKKPSGNLSLNLRIKSWLSHGLVVDFAMEHYGNYEMGRGLKWYRYVRMVKKFTWRISVPSSLFSHCVQISVENKTSLPWQGCWKNILHCKLLNFTTKLQPSNLKSNVKSTKRITSSVFTLQSSESWQTVSIISILKPYWKHTKEFLFNHYDNPAKENNFLPQIWFLWNNWRRVSNSVRLFIIKPFHILIIHV